MGDKNSLLVQHCIQHKYKFDFNDIKIKDFCSQWSSRLFLEACQSTCQCTINPGQLLVGSCLVKKKQCYTSFTSGLLIKVRVF